MANYIYITNLLLMVVALATAIGKFKHLDTAAQIFSWLLAVNLLTELSALVFRGGTNGNNHLYDYAEIIKVFLICSYFKEILPFLQPKNRGLKLALLFSFLALTVPLLSFRFPALSTYFLFLKSLFVISLSMAVLVRFVQQDSQTQRRYKIHSRLSATLLLFWTLTSFGWYIIHRYQQMDKELVALSSQVLLWVNLVFYLSILITYTQVKKTANNTFRYG